MLNWLGKLLVLSCFAILTACRANQSADLKLYLLQNPFELRDEIKLCESSKRDMKRCEAVVAAATIMQSLIEEQQRHPQEFGKRILRAQIQFAETGKGEEEIKILLAIVGLTGPE